VLPAAVEKDVVLLVFPDIAIVGLVPAVAGVNMLVASFLTSTIIVVPVGAVFTEALTDAIVLDAPESL
jgi:hypothetical protein